MQTDVELIELQATTLFRYDERRRMLCLNQADAAPAPRLFVGRTSAGNIWRFRHDLPDLLVDRLNQLLLTEPTTPTLHQPPRSLPALCDALEEHAPIARIWMGPAWKVPAELYSGETAVLISDANLAALERHFPWAIAELADVRPCAAVVEDGDAVSLCFSARTSLHAAEAGVETTARFRGRGFASAAVAAWALAVHSFNRVPLYSTSWDNLASRAVARKLHMSLYGADVSIE